MHVITMNSLWFQTHFCSNTPFPISKTSGSVPDYVPYYKIVLLKIIIQLLKFTSIAISKLIYKICKIVNENRQMDFKNLPISKGRDHRYVCEFFKSSHQSIFYHAFCSFVYFAILTDLGVCSIPCIKIWQQIIDKLQMSMHRTGQDSHNHESASSVCPSSL